MDTVYITHLGRQPYLPVWRAMQHYTQTRDAHSRDRLWLVEHPPVYTQGLNGRAEHLLAPGDIPVLAVDRGGQVTYHGPGQIVVYTLIDLNRKQWGVRRLVSALEQAVIDLLAGYGISAQARRDAPGVYVDGAKIAALGLRVKKGCSYHGLSLNWQMSLEPFSRINPCGYPGMAVTQLTALGVHDAREQIEQRLLQTLAARLAYNEARVDETLPELQELP